jgi:hypothetical protein
MIKAIVKDVLIEQHDPAETPTWTNATSLGDLKGKPFLKVTWTQETTETQAGKVPLGLTAKFELSSLSIDDDELMTSLKTMRGKNVSLKCVPVGTLSADRPEIIVKNFTLLLDGEINAGSESIVKLSGEKPAYDEDEIYELVTTNAS